MGLQYSLLVCHIWWSNVMSGVLQNQALLALANSTHIIAKFQGRTAILEQWSRCTTVQNVSLHRRRDEGWGMVLKTVSWQAKATSSPECTHYRFIVCVVSVRLKLVKVLEHARLAIFANPFRTEPRARLCSLKFYKAMMW